MVDMSKNLSSFSTPDVIPTLLRNSSRTMFIPKAPPRSRRNSLNSSLASSTLSLSSFKDIHPVHVGKEPPKRPSRKGRKASQLSTLSNIPEDSSTELLLLGASKVIERLFPSWEDTFENCKTIVKKNDFLMDENDKIAFSFPSLQFPIAFPLENFEEDKVPLSYSFDDSFLRDDEGKIRKYVDEKQFKDEIIDEETLNGTMDYEDTVTLVSDSELPKDDESFDVNTSKYHQLLSFSSSSSYSFSLSHSTLSLYQEKLKALKYNLCSSIICQLYPTEEDVESVTHFISCPLSLEYKYTNIRMTDLLLRNLRKKIELEALAEALSQLAKIGGELMKPETERNPNWRTLPISGYKGIYTVEAPWETIEGGSSILESLGYTEQCAFSLNYPQKLSPDLFVDHIGNLTVELVLASVEISTLILQIQPDLETLVVLQEAEAFPNSQLQIDYSVEENRQDKSHHQIESEYEEIGPGSSSSSLLTMKSQSICDLCGVKSALVKCYFCGGQIFCLACDDTYHRHPKRVKHGRKALDSKSDFRPPLPPKSENKPVAPPRRYSKKPSSSFYLTSLQNMRGRPLPSPPPQPSPSLLLKQNSLIRQKDNNNHNSSLCISSPFSQHWNFTKNQNFNLIPEVPMPNHSNYDNTFVHEPVSRKHERTVNPVFQSSDETRSFKEMYRHSQFFAPRLNKSSSLHDLAPSREKKCFGGGICENRICINPQKSLNTINHHHSHYHPYTSSSSSHSSKSIQYPSYSHSHHRSMHELSTQLTEKKRANKKKSSTSEFRSPFSSSAANKCASQILFSSSSDESEEDFFTGESDNDFMSFGSESKTGVWNCEHCTFVNRQNTTICLMCCRTSGRSLEINRGSLSECTKFEDERNENKEIKTRHKKDKNRRRKSRDSSRENEIYYEQRRPNDSKLNSQRQLYESNSSESTSSCKRPGRGILKKYNSNPVLYDGDERSNYEWAGTQSEFGTLERRRALSVISTSTSLSYTAKSSKDSLNELKQSDRGPWSHGKNQESKIKVGSQSDRRYSVDSNSGKRNFRSKRFSKNYDRKPKNSLRVQRDRQDYSESPDESSLSILLDRSESISPKRDESLHLHQDSSGYVSHGSGSAPLSTCKHRENNSKDSLKLIETVHQNDSELRNKSSSSNDLLTIQSKGSELIRFLREAEQSGFTAEDIQLALNHCGDKDPIFWLKDNWNNMKETVVTLATNVGHESEKNTIGTLSNQEASEALRKHKGNIWAAVTECVEERQRKFDDLACKGNFSREDIITMLTSHHGNSEAAFQELNKAQLKPFLMRIWGQSESDLEEKLDVVEISNESQKKESDSAENSKPSIDEESLLTPEEYEFNRKARRLVGEGKVSSFDKGKLALRLLMNDFSEEEAILGAENTESLVEATGYLRPECSLCTNTISITKLITLPSSCHHSCCEDCARNYFTLIIRDESIDNAVCPFCKEPSNLNETETTNADDYFTQLELLLKGLLESDIHELFQRKLRDRTLMRDPNFKWCYKCSSGFISDPKNKKLVCPDCRAMSCAKCLVPWEDTHEGISCEAFDKWKNENDPDAQKKGLEKHLAEFGIQCPSCQFTYTLTKGGCMHFICTMCKFEFCIGCKKPFKMGVKCGKGAGCARMGLHAHHPRNCLFYLRDKEPADLQRLLKKNKIDFETGVYEENKCSVPIQRESENGMNDEICGEKSPSGYNGYCKHHYTEYLCNLVFKHKIETVTLFELGELKSLFKRTKHFLPSQRPGEYEFAYKKRLCEMIIHEIPLDALE